MDAELVVFDCDGVLVDSEVIVFEVEADLLTAGGFPITADEIAERYVGLSYPDMMSGLEAQFGRPVPDSLSREVQDRDRHWGDGSLTPARRSWSTGPRCSRFRFEKEERLPGTVGIDVPPTPHRR